MKNGDTLQLPNINSEIWELPIPPRQDHEQSVHQNRTSYFASVGNSKIMGTVDQIAGHHNGALIHEYFRFKNGNVLLAGAKTADSSRLYTVYDPPLLLIPANIMDIDTILTCETRPIYYNEFTGMQDPGPKMYLKFMRLKTGRVKYKDKILDAVLCKLQISRDQEFVSGNKGLNLPKVIERSSHLLIGKGVGILLEWRTNPINSNLPQNIKINKKQNSKNMPDTDTGEKLEIILHEHNTV